MSFDDKESMKALAKRVYALKLHYSNLGMVNTYGLSDDERAELNINYIKARSAYLEAMSRLNESMFGGENDH